MSSTVFNIGNRNVTLKYTRKMPRGEVERMKSFVTKNGDKLVKTPKFKIPVSYTHLTLPTMCVV